MTTRQPGQPASADGASPASRDDPQQHQAGTAIDRFIAQLPKAELHVHHVGSASPQIVTELAQRHADSTSVPTDEAELTQYFTFRDFAHFVQVYQSVVDLIRDAQDVWTLTYEIGRNLAGQRVRYCELTLTPYTSMLRGIPAEAFCEAVEDARGRLVRDHDVRLAWCFDISGELGLPAADATLDAAIRLRPDGLVSFGLGGPEHGVDRRQFSDHFSRARAAGLHSVPHAGESTTAGTVWDAITHLGAERIGHGIRAAQDPGLMAYLAEHAVPLEVSPTSNVCTASVLSYEDHPLPALVAAGVQVSINSDDPPMFDTTVNGEYAVAARLLHLDTVGLTDLARASFQQSFLTDPDKAAYLREVDRYAAASSSTANPESTERRADRATR